MRFFISIAFALAAFSACAEKITATSWLVADEQGIIMRQENIDEVRPIGSITKLVTVMIVLDAKQPLDEQLGRFTRQQLIQLALVKSDNNAAITLCGHYPGGRENCIREMNTKVHDLYMKNTSFNEPSGLSMFDVSTANELVNLVIEAQRYPLIVEAAHTSTAKIKVKKKWFVFRNTNPIIGYNQHVIVSKTGYIRAAGGCLVMMVDTEVGRRILVLLGSKNTHTRIPEAEIIIKNTD
jgi:D-alanyl-D-alanine endopeptidase (penicillin-binding protein 7)